MSRCAEERSVHPAQRGRHLLRRPAFERRDLPAPLVDDRRRQLLAERLRQDVVPLERPYRLLQRRRQRPDPGLASALLGQRRRVHADRVRQRGPGREPGPPGSEQPRHQQIGVGGRVDALHLDVRGPLPVPRRAGHEADGGLPVLQPPAGERAGPVRRDQPQVGGDRRGADREQGRQVGQQAGDERLAVRGQPEPALAPAHEVLAVPPDRQVHVPAVADPLGEHLGRERGPQPVPRTHRLDRVPDQHAGVRCGDRVLGRDGQLQLPGRVLGVELVDRNALRRQRRQQVARVVGDLHVPRHPVGGTGEPGYEVVVARDPGRPLDLEGGPDGQPLAGQLVDDPAQEQPRVQWVRGAVLVVAVHRRPRPAGLAGQHGQPVEIRVQSQVADGAAGVAPGDDRVVEEEGVEHRAHADAPGRRRRQLGQWHRLHPGHAAGVHPRQDDADDAGLPQVPEHLLGARSPPQGPRAPPGPPHPAAGAPHAAARFLPLCEEVVTPSDPALCGSTLLPLDLRHRPLEQEFRMAVSPSRSGAPVEPSGPGLRRTLSVWQAVGLSVALMAPSMAANIKPQGTAGLVGRAVPLAFLLAAIGVLLVAYGFVRLCQYFHHAGSVYAFVGATLGPRTGLVSGFGLLGTYCFYGVVTSSATGIFGTAFLQAVGIWDDPPSWAPFLLAGVALVGALALTVVPAKRGTSVLLSVEGATVALILVVSAIVLVRLLSDNVPADAPSSSAGFTLDVFTVAPGTELSAVFLGVVFGFLSFAGFEAAATLGEEARNPRRDIPRASRGTAVFGGIYFVVVPAIEMMGFGSDDAGVAAFTNSSSLLGDLGSIYIADWVGDLITLGAAISAFGCCLACVVGASRLTFAFARDTRRDTSRTSGLATTSAAGTPAVAAIVVTAVMALIQLV